MALLCSFLPIKTSFYVTRLQGAIAFSLSLAELDQSLQGLLSFERLDRASPDLWPEQSKFKF